MPKAASAHPVDDHEREQDEDSDSGEMGGRDVRVDSVEEVEPIPEISVDYIVVDPKGVQLRHSRAYVKNSKTGELLGLGQVVRICQRVSEHNMIWLKLADGRGWGFERTDRRRMSEVRYRDLSFQEKQAQHLVSPQMSKVSLLSGPHTTAHSALTVAGGSMVHVLAEASIFVAGAKSKSPDVTQTYSKIVDESGVEGWLPEGSSALVPYKLERLDNVAGDGETWLSVLASHAPVHATPSTHAPQPAGTLKLGDFVQVVEKLEAAGLIFYKLADGGWLHCKGNEKHPHFDLGLREDHWWQYMLKSRKGTELRQVPTRAKERNNGKHLKDKQLVLVSEKIKFESGQEYVHCEPPYAGWAPVTKTDGTKKMIPQKKVEAKRPPKQRGKAAPAPAGGPPRQMVAAPPGNGGSDFGIGSSTRPPVQSGYPVVAPPSGYHSVPPPANPCGYSNYNPAMGPQAVVRVEAGVPGPHAYSVPAPNPPQYGNSTGSAYQMQLPLQRSPSAGHDFGVGQGHHVPVGGLHTRHSFGIAKDGPQSSGGAPSYGGGSYPQQSYGGGAY